jgi:hypothetical protein
LIILKEHKEFYGISTKIIKLIDIYQGKYFPVVGRDDAEKIKYFLKDAQETWNIKYVMLVGGIEDMPVRFVESKFAIIYNFFICDLYFADIYDDNGDFCSWDSNRNNVFGEVDGSSVIDNVDLYPDIFVGRILCKNESEIDLVVNKIINYENNAYGSDWFHRIVIFGGDSQPSFLEFIFPILSGRLGSIAFEGEYLGDRIANILDDFEAARVYGSGFLRSDALMLTNENVNDAINEGAGFVLLSGHGSPISIWNYLPFSIIMDYRLPRPIGYTSNEVKDLVNSEKLPIVIFSACSCGDFNYTSCPIAWEFIKNENGGAIACIANTNPSYLIPSTLCTETVNGHLTITFYDAYVNGIDVIGDLWAETIIRYMDDETPWNLTPLNWGNFNVSVMTLEVWTLFGDPSLKIGGYPG